MLATLVTSLFAASAFLALGVIGDSWRRHGGAWARLRQELAQCGQVQEFRYTIVTTEVRRSAVAQPAFTPQTAWSLPLQPAQRAA